MFAHTRRFGTLAGPPPPVGGKPWGPHTPGHLLFCSFFFQIPSLNSLEFFHSLSTAAFASGIFHRLLHRKMDCVTEISPLPATRSSCVLDRKDSARCLVDSGDSTIPPHVVLGSLFIATLRFCIRLHDARMLLVHPLARHGWCHKYFQLSSCVFENF